MFILFGVNNNMNKKCYKCEIIKPISEFTIDNKKKDRLKIYCRSCCNDQYWENTEYYRTLRRNRYIKNKEKERLSQEIYMGTLWGRYIGWKTRAKSRKINFNIEYEYIEKLPMICAYTGVELTCKKNFPNTISLDRIDNIKGYIRGNVVLCCSIINYMKQEMKKRDFIEWCRKVVEYVKN